MMIQVIVLPREDFFWGSPSLICNTGILSKFSVDDQRRDRSIPARFVLRLHGLQDAESDRIAGVGWGGAKPRRYHGSGSVTVGTGGW